MLIATLYALVFHGSYRPRKERARLCLGGTSNKISVRQLIVKQRFKITATMRNVKNYERLHPRCGR